MGLEAAFAKASAELGDVSAVADELSLKKRTEVFEEAYMDIRRYMSAGRVAGYVVFGVVALFGIITALIVFFATKGNGLDTMITLSGVFATMMPFLVTAIAGFTFLGVTQETASMYPVRKLRTIWYTVAATLIAFGIFAMPIVFFGIKIKLIEKFNEWMDIVPLICLFIPFILPGIGILVFLVLTEKDRLKPWAKDFRNKAVEREMAMWNDPATATRFGMFSGAIWIFTTGLFFLLGFLIGFKFSWLIFIFATAFQLLVQGLMSKRENDQK
jgi:MFS family permease